MFGTVADFVVVHDDARVAHAAIDAATLDLERVDRLMSRFRPESDVSRANAAARGVAVAVSEETALVVEEALRWAEASDGGFDPCIGRAIQLWDVTHRHEPPPADAVQRLAGRELFRSVDVDRWSGGRVLVRGDDDVALDLGGIAVGRAVDLAVARLRACGVRDAVLNVGGDIVAIGRSADGDRWRVGIRSPHDASILMDEVELEDQAIATSGDYEQSFVHEGVRWHHILDPRTAKPRRTSVHSVTVVAPTCMEADAATTSVFGVDDVAARRLLAARAPGAQVVAVS